MEFNSEEDKTLISIEFQIAPGVGSLWEGKQFGNAHCA